MTSEHEMQNPPLPLLVFRLRALVLALGESTAPAWWKTELMNETGLRFLERLYPRTSFQAAVHAAGKAASDAHDRAVGRVGVYHLFRLPESLETEINRMLPDSDEGFVSTHIPQFSKLFQGNFIPLGNITNFLTTMRPPERRSTV